MTAQVAYLVGTHAPAKWGGQGDLYPKIEEEAAKSGKSLDDAAKEVNLPTQDEIDHLDSLFVLSRF